MAPLRPSPGWDGTGGIFTPRLRQGVCFHDGARLDAAAARLERAVALSVNNSKGLFTITQQHRHAGRAQRGSLLHHLTRSCRSAWARLAS